MPTETEIEAAAEELIKAQHPTFLGRPKHMVRQAKVEAEAALTAAERVRTDPERREARTEVHTCHTDCPCQSGGEPVSDFVEARTQHNPVVRRSELNDLCRRNNLTPPAEPETGQPIPDEAIEAGLAEYLDGPLDRDDREEVEAVITAALPHLEAAWREDEPESDEAVEAAYPFLDETGQPAAPRVTWQQYEAEIRADERAKVRERVEAERLTLDRPDLLTPEGLEQDKAYNRAIDDVIRAIKEDESNES